MLLATSVLPNVVCSFGRYLSDEAVTKARDEVPFSQGLSALVKVTDHTLWLALRVELSEFISYSVRRVHFVEIDLLGLVNLKVERSLEPRKVQGSKLLPDLLDDGEVGAAILFTWLSVEQVLKIKCLQWLLGFLFGVADFKRLLLKTSKARLSLVELRLMNKLVSNSSYTFR
jgi:hypothetical protein